MSTSYRNIRTTWFTQQKQWGLCQNKVTSSFAAIQRLHVGHWTDNCRMVCSVQTISLARYLVWILLKKLQYSLHISMRWHPWFGLWRRYITHFIIWLSLRVGKMTQITRCDWLPKQAIWSHLARSGLPTVSHKKNFPKSHIINPLLTY